MRAEAVCSTSKAHTVVIRNLTQPILQLPFAFLFTCGRGCSGAKGTELSFLIVPLRYSDWVDAKMFRVSHMIVGFHARHLYDNDGDGLWLVVMTR